MLYARARLPLLPPPSIDRAQRVAALSAAMWVSMLGAQPALGDTDDPLGYARPGPYAHFGLALGVERYGWLAALDAAARVSGTAALAAPGTGPVDTGFSTTTFLGFDLGAGYRITKRLAADVSFEWASATLWADVIDRSATLRVRSKQPRADIETWILTFNGRFYVTTGRLQPFVLGGIGAMKATPASATGISEAHGFASRWGGGLDFYMTRRVVATALASYVVGTGDTGKSDFLSFRALLTWRR